MFEHHVRFQSDAERRRHYATKQGETFAQWQREAETWFDGSLQSVDRRLAMCQRLLTAAEAKMARVGLRADDGNAMALVGALQTSKQALTELRHDMITGGSWRHEPVPESNPRRDQQLMASLSSEDRRYVELTSAAIVAADDGLPPGELAIQARYRAARDTSAFHEVRAERVGAALALRTSQRAQQRPRVKTAARPSAIPDYPAELMYL